MSLLFKKRQGISIHAPTGGATASGIVANGGGVCISIHAPTGGATRSPLMASIRFFHFNPRSHGGSDCFFLLIIFDITLFQSTLPRGERLILGKEFIWHKIISIHAPTGGATIFFDECYRIFRISIHAPTGGATRLVRGRKGARIFQSTLPRGERLWTARRSSRVLRDFNPRSHGGSDIDPSRKRVGSKMNFNPRSHGGSDDFSTSDLTRLLDFNPRSHGGSDGVAKSAKKAAKDFNPRSHGGSDNRGVINMTKKIISIHAPTGGATGKCFCVDTSSKFQSTLPRGERLIWKMRGKKTQIFQSTLPRGERLLIDDVWSGGSRFQSTLPRGERLRREQ